jgi:recombination protein RecA
LIYGWEASGKTTLSTRIIAAAQKKYPDQAAVFIDLEGTYSPAWGAAHGIDNSRMVVVQPDGGEQALDLARGVIQSKETSIVVVDSLAALVPIKEQQKAMEDATVGEQGKMIARFCRVIQNDMIQERKRAHRPAILLINQFRMKIGVMFGDPRTLPGGLAQHYAASTKIEIKNKEIMGKDAAGRQTVDHNVHSFNLKKSKIGTGVREGEFKMIRNQDHWAGAGFVDDANTIITWARAAGHITGGGSSWRIAGVDTKFGRLSDMADYLYSDIEFATRFKDMLIQEYRQQCGLIPEYL